VLIELSLAHTAPLDRLGLWSLAVELSTLAIIFAILAASRALIMAVVALWALRGTEPADRPAILRSLAILARAFTPTRGWDLGKGHRPRQGPP